MQCGAGCTEHTLFLYCGAAWHRPRMCTPNYWPSHTKPVLLQIFLREQRPIFPSDRVNVVHRNRLHQEPVVVARAYRSDNQRETGKWQPCSVRVRGKEIVAMIVNHKTDVGRIRMNGSKKSYHLAGVEPMEAMVAIALRWQLYCLLPVLYNLCPAASDLSDTTSSCLRLSRYRRSCCAYTTITDNQHGKHNAYYVYVSFVPQHMSAVGLHCLDSDGTLTCAYLHQLIQKLIRQLLQGQRR